MAQNVGGYDCTFVEDPPDSLKCLICLSVTRDPQQHGDCGKLFCNSCITEHRKTSNDCPHCRQLLVTFNDGRSAQEVRALKVKCDKGCKWVGELRSLEDHFKTCENIPIPCTNKCRAIIQRKNLQNHLSKKCPKRIYPCQYCGEVGEYKERTEVHILKCSRRPHRCQYCGEIGEYKERTEVHILKCPRRPYECPLCHELGDFQQRAIHIQKCPRRQHECHQCGQFGEYLEITTIHLDKCPRAKIPCPNNCGETILHFQEKEHRLKCRYEMVTCKYKVIGCQTTDRRGDIRTHEEESLLHLNMATKTILTLSTAMIELENRQMTLNNSKPLTFIFKVREFKSYKDSGSKFYSTPFYTHNGGYKMCAVVIPDGCGESKGTHVAVAACLMKGEYDDSLTWPFTGSVTFELLNQLEDKNHHTYTTPSFPANKIEVSGRVVNGERGKGLGKNKFILLSDLRYNPDKYCQYLSDDTLVFRVSVEVPNRKPWLECTV